MESKEELEIFNFSFDPTYGSFSYNQLVKKNRLSDYKGQNVYLITKLPKEKHHKWPKKHPGHLFNFRVQAGAFNR